MFVRLDSSTYKYIYFDKINSHFTLYNLNHSVFMNVTIPITFNSNSSAYQIAYVSKSLFDCDTSNIEYALSFLGDGNPTSYPKRFYVYRTNGTQLVNIDSCCFLNYSNGWQYGPLYNEPVVNTPIGSKLILRHLDGSTRIYSICGLNLTGIKKYDVNNELGNPFPNPTEKTVTISYSLPEGEKNGTIKIYDSNGKEIRSYAVDNNFLNISLTIADLENGIYYYQLITSKGQTGTKKLIKID